MNPNTHNIKTSKNKKHKKCKILCDDKSSKTEEELQKEEETLALKTINKLKNCSDNKKSKLIFINSLKTMTDKLKNQNMQKESNDLRNKYEPKYYDFYNMISDIICAKNSSSYENKLTQEDFQKYDIQNDNSDIEPIKDFWVTVIERACYFIFKDIDKEILSHLINVHSNLKINNDNDKYSSIFKISFFFEENEFFSNNELTKVYYYGEKSDGKIVKVDFPKIEWKENKKPKEESFFDMFDEKECKLEESQSEVEYIRNDFLPNILELYMNFQDDSEADDYDNYA